MNARLRHVLTTARGNPYNTGTLLKILEKLDDEEQRVLLVTIDNLTEEAKQLAASRLRQWQGR